MNSLQNAAPAQIPKKASFSKRFWAMFRYEAQVTWAQMKKSKWLYLFMMPFLLLFTVFEVLPVIISIFYSFTYYNVLEPPEFIAFQNYINLVLQDEVFLTSIKNKNLINWFSCAECFDYRISALYGKFCKSHKTLLYPLITKLLRHISVQSL